MRLKTLMVLCICLWSLISCGSYVMNREEAAKSSDFQELINNWLVEGSIAVDITGDKIVNLEDYMVLTLNWLECSHPDDPSCDWEGP